MKLFIFVLVLIVGEIKCQYLITATKYTCNKDGVQPGITKITLVGSDIGKARFAFEVEIKIVKPCNQRCTLIAWTSARNIQKTLNKTHTIAPALATIEISNSMFVSEAQYKIKANVSLDGKFVKVAKPLILDCEPQTSPLQSEQHVPTSFRLIGANATYCDMLYILNAETNECNITCNYYFKWDILERNGKLYHADPTKGSELQIPPDFLKMADGYVINCSLINGQNGLVVKTILHNLRILKRDMVLQFASSTMVVGVRKPFQLTVNYQNIDNPNGKLDVKWSCKTDKNKNCLDPKSFRSVDHKTANFLSLECDGLPNVESYYFSVIASDNRNTKRDACLVKSTKEGFVEIYIDSFEASVDPSKEIEVPVYVNRLVAGCTLQWTSVKAPNYKYLRQTTNVGNINFVKNIRLARDDILNEIDEFSNQTINIVYGLKIPSPNSIKKINWKGLEANSSYLFRINVTCPNSKDEEWYDENTEPLITQNMVSVYADVILNTASLLSLNQLKVIPKTGIALKTIFTFDYDDNNGSNVHYPILYKFGYYLNNEIIYISNLLGVTSTKSILPYIDGGVKTILIACNSQSLCSELLGPLVKTEIPNISQEDHKKIKERLLELIGREEYYKMFALSLLVLQTYNNSKIKVYLPSMESYIKNLTSSEIKRLLMKSADGDQSWIAPANKLINSVGMILNRFTNSHVLISNVIALRNELSRKGLLKYAVADSVELVSRKRRHIVNSNYIRSKRAINRVTLEEVKNYLALSEMIITTSPSQKRVQQEKKHIISQVDKFMPGLCASLYYKSGAMNLELRTLIISVEKINKNVFDKYLHISFPENTWNVNGRLKLGRCYSETLGDQLCLGKVVFKNYFNVKGFVYMLKMYGTQSNDQGSIQKLVCGTVLVFPVAQNQNKEAKCMFWKSDWTQSQCKTLQLKSTAIQCACTNLGYYSLEYTQMDKQVTTTKPLNLVASKNVSIKATTALVKTTTSRNAITVKTTKRTVKGKTSKTTKRNNITALSIIKIASFDKDEDLTVHYVIIGTTLTGILVLIYGIWRLWPTVEEPSEKGFPKYASLHDEDMLCDAPKILQ